MQTYHRQLMLVVIILAGLLAACGAPEDMDATDQAPGRADLIARLQSPSESDELARFRIKSELRISGQLSALDGAAGMETGVTTMQADVQTDPAALHMATTFDAAVGPSTPQTVELLVADDQLWVNHGDGWFEQEAEMTDLTAWLLDAFTRMANPLGAFVESPETADLLRDAELIGAEEVNGRRTTHFRLATEALVGMLMENYDSSTVSGNACDDLDAPGEAVRDLGDGEDMARFFECMGAAFAGVLPAPEEYFERYEVDLWISDDGLVMRERTVMELAYLPLAAIFDETDEPALALEISYDLYDLNADFEIAPPSAE